jgi:hypothetical protein
VGLHAPQQMLDWTERKKTATRGYLWLTFTIGYCKGV